VRTFSLSYSRRGAAATPPSSPLPPSAPAPTAAAALAAGAPLAAAVLEARARSGDADRDADRDARFPGLTALAWPAGSCSLVTPPRSALSSSAAASAASLASLLDHALSLAALPPPEARCSSRVLAWLGLGSGLGLGFVFGFGFGFG